jgi:cytidylate kinase
MTGVGAQQRRVPDVSELVRVVALDGPAGSGKSTVARLTAQALGWRFVDTGATYRAITLHVLRSGADLDDTEAVARAAREAQVDLDVDPSARGVRLNGGDVSAEIRGPLVTAAVSGVSAVPAVRAQLIELQRALMGTEGAVVEGRDIATVVAPLAAVKVYLDAREDVRARRRAADVDAGVGPKAGALGTELSAGASEPLSAPAGSAPGTTSSGSSDDRIADVRDVQADLRRRDALDSQTNKLEVSEGAIHLDTSDLTIDEVVAAVVALVRAAGLVSEGDSS